MTPEEWTDIAIARWTKGVHRLLRTGKLEDTCKPSLRDAVGAVIRTAVDEERLRCLQAMVICHDKLPQTLEYDRLRGVLMAAHDAIKETAEDVEDEQ